MKRILHIQVLPLLCGGQNVMLNILDGLPADEWDIHVAAAGSGPLSDEIIKRGWHYHSINNLVRLIHPIDDTLALIQLYRLIKKHKFDIVHTHSSKPGILGRLAARLNRTPLIVHTVHGYAFHPFQNAIINNIYKASERLAANWCHKIIFVNEHERLLTLKQKLAKPGQVVTIYNGVEVGPKPVKQAKSGKIKVCSVLRFWQQKNIIQTLQAVIMACRANHNLEFTFFGDGHHWNLANKMVSLASMQNRIFLPGWNDNIKQQLSNYDLFMLYSLWEGLPLSILEAMAAGLGVVASKIKGNDELVIHGVNGYLVKPNDTLALYNCLVDLPDKETLLEWGHKSYHIAAGRFNLKQSQQKYIQLYQHEL